MKRMNQGTSKSQSSNVKVQILRGVAALALALGCSAIGSWASAEMTSRGAPRLDSPASDSDVHLNGNEVRTSADAPRTSILGGPGYFNAAAGIGFPGGLRTDNSMLNLTAGYNMEYTTDITGKAFGNFNLGTGSDSAYFNDVAVGANYAPSFLRYGAIKPYVGADAGIGFAKNTTGDSAASLALGAGAGFQWMARQTALDVQLRYEVLAGQLDGANPQVLGLNAGMDF